MPAIRVTANAVSAPRRPVNVRLADNVAAPSAMKMFPNANMRGEETLRVAVAVSAGVCPAKYSIGRPECTNKNNGGGNGRTHSSQDAGKWVEQFAALWQLIRRDDAVHGRCEYDAN